MQQIATLEPDSLSPRQQRAIFTLLSEPALEEAAKQAGIQRSTLWRWLQDSSFRSAYNRLVAWLCNAPLLALKPSPRKPSRPCAK